MVNLPITRVPTRTLWCSELVYAISLLLTVLIPLPSNFILYFRYSNNNSHISIVAFYITLFLSSVLWCCWTKLVEIWRSIWPVKIHWWCAGMVICLEWSEMIKNVSEFESKFEHCWNPTIFGISKIPWIYRIVWVWFGLNFHCTNLSFIIHSSPLFAAHK